MKVKKGSGSFSGKDFNGPSIKPPGKAKVGYDADSLKLLQELKVHQIELEMQNAELIEQRNRAEEATERYLNLYNEIYNIAPSGYFTVTRAGNICELNLYGAKLFGVERSKLHNRNLASLLSNNTRPAFKNLLNEVFVSQIQSSCEVTTCDPSDNQIHIHLRATLSTDTTKCLIAAVDITYLKRIEKELKDSKEKLDMALDIGNLGIWRWDIKDDRMLLDDRLERMLGIQNPGFQGTFGDFENFLNEEDLLHFREAIKKLMDKNIPFSTIFRVRENYGNAKYLISKALLSRDFEGTPSEIMGACFDVSELKISTEKAIFRLNEELLRSNNELNQFAYIVSHDLQEPLRMISSFAQLLTLRYTNRLDDQADEYIKFIVEGSNHLYELLNGLLLYSRIRTKAFKFTTVDMNHVVNQALQNLSIKIAEKQASFKLDNFPPIVADQSQMIQLVQNLADNAIKFSPRATTISISCHRENDFYVFSIHDEGIGIESGHFDRIFSIFQRLVKEEEFPGAGVGLAICKRVVERHGGRIWVESEPGKGSTFNFTIPAETGEDLIR